MLRNQLSVYVRSTEYNVWSPEFGGSVNRCGSSTIPLWLVLLPYRHVFRASSFIGRGHTEYGLSGIELSSVANAFRSTICPLERYPAGSLSSLHSDLAN